ncbi:MAG: hypothetical protein PHP08_00025 [Candidatus Dojkabacteria bacterium]|nr:hypothetical protein [Candidatus Dojkabacteria bacterium]
MAVILGTVPGWERDSDWDSDNRTYIGPGYTKYIGESISEDEAHYYRMIIDITVYLYESPCRICQVAVTRRINDIEIIGLFRIEYRGGLDRWIDVFSKVEAEEILDRSIDEVGGLIDCSNCTRFDINIIESEYIPPLPRIPEIATTLYRELSNEIGRERRRIESNKNEIADILTSVPRREELTSSQRSEIRRLDSEIRRSNDIIRDNESEIRNLERQYPGIGEEI